MSASPDQTLGRLDAAPDNVLLAVGGSAQLTFTAASLTGTPITDFDSVAYRLATAGDSNSIHVNSAGLVTGRTATGSSLQVNVVGFRKGVWNGDAVLVQVTPTAVPGLTLSVQPPSGDSAKLASGVAKTITPIFRNPTTGQTVNGILLQYAVRSADEMRVSVFARVIVIRGVFNASRVSNSVGPAAARNQIVPWVGQGTAWIYANVNAYGTMLQDSVLYTFTYPYTGSVVVTKNNLAVVTTLDAGDAVSGSVAADITIAPGGTVTFSNGVSATDPLTVVFAFDNPAAATVASPASTTGGASGNVTTLIGGQSARRVFLTPGTYRWTWVASGGPAPWNGQAASGRIVVK